MKVENQTKKIESETLDKNLETSTKNSFQEFHLCILRKAQKCLRLIAKAQDFLLDELLLAVELVGEGEEDSLHMVGHRVILGTCLKQRHPSATHHKKTIYLL